MEGLFYDEHCAVSGARLPGRGASPTMGEAEAKRAGFEEGWRAAIEAAAGEIENRSQRVEYEQLGCGDRVTVFRMLTVDEQAAAIRALPVPEGGR